jgi:hypothetical protein
VTGNQVQGSTAALSDSTPATPLPTGTSSTYAGPASSFKVTYEALASTGGSSHNHHGRGGPSGSGAGSGPGSGSGWGFGLGSSWGWSW